MSYTVHTTEAFILGSTPTGEANKIFHLFTRDFGVIIATAQGVRLSKSKLKPHLLDYSFSNISLVKGKEIWRITSASSIERVHNAVYVQILSIIRRLLQGEGEHTELFDYLKEKLFQNIDETEIMIRILSELGYVDKKDLIDADKHTLVSIINRGLKESHL